MTAYLFAHFRLKKRTAILSRGYGRKTKGLLQADGNSSPQQIGDEPYWYQTRFKDAKVVVSESRKKGMQFLETTDSELVLLDDAYQHRAFKADIYLLLSEFSSPYFKDFPMPYGRLREFRTGDKRADMIVFTKCPFDLSKEDKIDYILKANPLEHQQVFFTALRPSVPKPMKGTKTMKDISFERIIVLSGIANPDSFIELCKQWNTELIVHSYKDHYDYTASDIEDIQSDLNKAIVICTEKDEVKLRDSKLYSLLLEDTYFCLPVDIVFLFNEEEKFLKNLELTLKNTKKAFRKNETIV